jgi:anti-sigma-K factor RskA
MDKEQFLKTGLLEQYVLGLTDEEESELVEQFAKQHSDIAQEIDSMREALEEYAMQYVKLPPEELKKRVMQSVDEEISAGQHRPDTAARSTGSALMNALPSFFMIACILGLGLLAYLFYEGKTNVEQNYVQLSAAFDNYKLDCESKQSQAVALEEIYKLLQHHATEPVKLSGSSIAPTAQAVAYLNPVAEKAIINLTKLPTPPEGKTYQLWADVEGHMVNMGVIEFEKNDFQMVTFIEGAESLNITLEPNGGSKEPTVELLYVNGKV